ncbi:MAG: hypothetical protein DHS20C14_06320 [Phycisphaeraceae bacterium]|nr:MAG: hypothetical protein DHS20C14_06320 [Phycisphaeraceae bacterium]
MTHANTPRRTGARPGLAARPAVALALAMALALGAAACNKTPLRKDDQRSQFDRYDATRNERAPAYVQDAFGRRQPNLRGRLLGND